MHKSSSLYTQSVVSSVFRPRYRLGHVYIGSTNGAQEPSIIEIVSTEFGNIIEAVEYTPKSFISSLSLNNRHRYMTRNYDDYRSTKCHINCGNNNKVKCLQIWTYQPMNKDRWGVMMDTRAVTILKLSENCDIGRHLPSHGLT